MWSLFLTDVYILGPTVTNSPCNRNTIGYQLPGVQSVDTSGYYFFGPPLKGL